MRMVKKELPHFFMSGGLQIKNPGASGGSI
jgi:hypothetical protein